MGSCLLWSSGLFRATWDPNRQSSVYLSYCSPMRSPSNPCVVSYLSLKSKSRSCMATKTGWAETSQTTLFSEVMCKVKSLRQQEVAIISTSRQPTRSALALSSSSMVSKHKQISFKLTDRRDSREFQHQFNKIYLTHLHWVIFKKKDSLTRDSSV